jgi:hypothetical protein
MKTRNQRNKSKMCGLTDRNGSSMLYYCTQRAEPFSLILF